MGVPISTLPPAAAATTAQLIPVVNDPLGAPATEKLTVQQLLTLIQTALASVALTGNKIALNNDGTASFANNKISMETDGTLLSLFATIGAGAEIVLNGNTGGDAHFASEKTVFAADGSASFANGAATIGADGGIKANYSNLGGIGFGDGSINIFDSAQAQQVALSATDFSVFNIGVLVNNGSGNSVNVGGTLKVNTTTTGNIGAGEDDLIAFTVPANTLANDGEYLEFDCWGSFAATATAKDLKMYFDSTSLFDTTSIILNGKDWRAHGKIVRTAVDSFLATVEFTVGGTLLSAVNGTVCKTTIATGVDSLASTAAIFKCTGQDNGVTPANNAVVQNAMVLKWYPAQ